VIKYIRIVQYYSVTFYLFQGGHMNTVTIHDIEFLKHHIYEVSSPWCSVLVVLILMFVLIGFFLKSQRQKYV
jgi:ABC-type transport system involved in cytochrome bd biosynthesis fused ATPase/permease subunit